MIPILVLHQITSNIHSKIEIFQNNIKKLNSFIASDEYQSIEWVEQSIIRDNLTEQKKLLEYYISERNRLDNLTFRFGS
jgi:hypothetical protein